MLAMRHETKISTEAKRSILLPAALWLLFAAGLILQAFSPHLAIEHNSFVIPESVYAPGSTIDPRALVQRQRYMQGLSALLVVVSVIGLGIRYRRVLSQSLSRG
jgi:NhaP-type Na+/H+ or K+/H+ antiporter